MPLEIWESRVKHVESETTHGLKGLQATHVRGGGGRRNVAEAANLCEGKSKVLWDRGGRS